MKNNKRKILISITTLVAALIVSACGGSSNRFIANSWPGMTVKEDGVYVANNQHIYKIDPSNGTELARYPQEASRATFFAPPVFVGDKQLIASGYDNVLYSFDVSSGDELWNFPNGNRFIGAPLVTDTAIYAPNSDHQLHAIDHDGQELWTFETEEPLWASPVTDGLAIYQVSMDGSMYAINPSTGIEIWHTDLGAAAVNTPALQDGILYIGTFNSEIIALETNTGKILWHSPLNDWGWASPVISDNVLYATDLEGWIYAIDTQNGTRIWEYQGEGSIAGSVLVDGDSLYTASGAGNVYAFSLDGSLRWSRSAGEEVILYGTPKLAGDYILIGVVESDFIIIAYDKNGTVQWQFEPES